MRRCKLDDDAAQPTTPPKPLPAAGCTAFDFYATGWSTTCGAETCCPNGKPDGPTNFTANCATFRNILPPILANGFGVANASTLVPQLIHGLGDRWNGITSDMGNGVNGSNVWGLKDMPVGHRSLRISGSDRHAIMSDAADDILGGWNATNKSYPPDQACQADVIGWAGGGTNAFYGLWWDAAAKNLGAQSDVFFKTLRSAGGADILSEIILDTELFIEEFDTWSISDNWAGCESCLITISSLLLHCSFTTVVRQPSDPCVINCRAQQHL